VKADKDGLLTLIPRLGIFEVSTVTDGENFESFTGEPLSFFRKDVPPSYFPDTKGVANKLKRYEISRQE